MTTPYISLGLMLGDAHVEVLGRCLRSVLERSSGPMVDEIVIGWNGKNHRGLDEALTSLGYHGEKGQPWACAGNPPVQVIPFEWPGRFDTARNSYWKYLQGEWCFWLDADDVVADAGTPAGLAAIERVEKDYGLPPMPAALDAPVTLKTWLSSLPPQVNVVYSPYNYSMDANNYVQVRQKMKRIVRRSAGHIWHSPEQSGVHEILTCIGGVPEKMAETFGLLIQHYPSQSELERVVRNREIVEKLTAPGVLSDPRHAYDVANAALSAGNLSQANEAISQAIVHAHNDMDAYTYRLARAFIGMQEGNPEKMLQEAFAAIGLLPELRDAYFIVCDAYYRMGKWLAVIEWFERGVAKTPTLLSRDQPLAAFTSPRAQAALAYTYIGLTEKALKLIEEMEKEYPLAGLTIEAGTKVRALMRQQNGETSLFAALDFLHVISPNAAYKMLGALKHTHALDVLRSTVPWAALERRISDSTAQGGLKLDRVNGTDVLSFYDRGLINLDDVLDQLNQLNPTLQLLAAEVAPERRSVKAVTRSRATSSPKRIAFYAPIGVKRWECGEYETFGMGGSESSVALLARELTDRGHIVTVFTNKPTTPITTLWHGVIQKDCSQYRPTEWAGDDLVIFCRAPWMAREDPPVTKNIWCWHQDNGYANKWMWNPDVVSKQGHLFVSQYAMGSLLRDAGLTPGLDGTLDLSAVKWAVVGNGILAECARKTTVPRRPLSVIYASNPSRGLNKLLEAWPLVLAQEPAAQLSVACEWAVMLATDQDEPGFSIPQKVQALQTRMHTTPNVSDLGWLSQDKLLEVLRATDVCAYPGGPMPEGFGVVLVQAQAAGCKVVAPREGALSEVLDEHATTWIEGSSADPVNLAAHILGALRSDPPPPVRTSRFFWANVAERVLQVSFP